VDARLATLHAALDAVDRDDAGPDTLSDVDELRLRVTLWMAGKGGRTHAQLLDALQLWHTDRRTPTGELVALRQAYVAFLIFSDELTLEATAAAIGKSVKTVRRDLKTLEEVFGLIRDGCPARRDSRS
jgi:hypothetical protein